MDVVEKSTCVFEKRIVLIAKPASSMLGGKSVRTARYSSFDRGFDLGHAEIPPTSSPKIERKYDPKGPSSMNLKKLLAFAMVAVMVTSAMVIFVPAIKKNLAQGPGPEDQQPTRVGIGGQRIVNYTISNMFENYPKPPTTQYNLLGKQQGSIGFPQWYPERNTIGGYPDTIVHNTYPLVLAYDYYSGSNAFKNYKNEPHMAFGLYTFFRMNIKAENLTSPATGVGKDPNIIPMLSTDGLARDGGWVNFTWYLTYLPLAEVSDIQNGTHYANSFYKVPYKIGAPPKDPPGESSPLFTGNDGWFNEIQGTMNFTRAAAHKFLNLPLAAADLRTAFFTNNSGGGLNTINVTWATQWATDGSGPSNKWDIYATYDYDLLTDPPFDTYLTLDPASTANNLVVRIWGHSWGYEILMERYLESFGVAKFFQTYPEDFYINGTIGAGGSDLTVRETSTYKFLAWKDLNFWAPAWNMDTWHMDATPNSAGHTPAGWPSRYGINPNGGQYYEKLNNPVYLPRKMEWGPGTDLYGTQVMYWQAPQGFNLTDRERVVIKLPTLPILGYNPFRGTFTWGDLPGQGAAVVANLSASASWGELVLGHGYPASLYSSTYYNNVTKSIVLKGPLTLNNNPNENPVYPAINETGCPDFVFGVSRVSYYKVEVTVPGPYNAGVSYTLRVTARNLTGNTVTNWNGTVNLFTNNVGSTFGANGSSHVYTPANNGVWFTTIVFNTPSKPNTFVNATDSHFPLDVFWAGPNQAAGGGSISIGVLIPEFPTLLIPVIGISATVAVIARRRKKDQEE